MVDKAGECASFASGEQICLFLKLHLALADGNMGPTILWASWLRSGQVTEMLHQSGQGTFSSVSHKQLLPIQTLMSQICPSEVDVLKAD